MHDGCTAAGSFGSASDHDEEKEEIKMTVQDFIIEAKKSVAGFLDSVYEEEIELVDHDIVKSNDRRLHGFVVRRAGSQEGANVYIDDLFEMHESGEDFDKLMEMLRAKCLFALECPPPPVDMLDDMDLESIRSRLTLRLLDVRRNMSYLADRPYIDAGCGLALVVDIGCDETILSEWRTTVTDGILETIGCSREELLTAAMKNTISMEPPLLMNLADYLRTREEVNILEPSHSGNASEPGPFILTNSSQYNGAAVLFYPEMLRKLCGLFQGGYYVLPISIHEVLIIPESDSPDEYRLCGMLFTGNRSVVEEGDVLSDIVLHFDPGRECLSVVQAGGTDVISEENSFEKNSRPKQLDCVQEPVQYPA